MSFRRILTALLAVVLLSGAFAQQRIALGATNATSSHYGYFAALAKIINENVEDVQASVVETGATVDNLARMARGQIDMGLITTNTLYHAYYGQQGFADQPIESELLWVYSLAPQNIIVRRDSGIEDISALEGVRYGPGQRGSSTEATSQLVMELFGVAPEWVRGSNDELAAAIKDNRAAGFIKSAVNQSFDPLTQDIATFTPLRVLGLSDEQVALIQENLPELSIVDMPGGDAEGTGPYTTYGFLIGVSAAPELDEELAYQITKAVMEDEVEQASAFPGLDGVDLAALTMQYATSPLHPGAIRYYREAGYEIPERLLGE